MGNKSKISPSFKVNEYLTLRLEDVQTNIYIKGKLFSQCKFLLLNIPINETKELDYIDSIDEAAERLDTSMERRRGGMYNLSPEIEFWGHCSNLQAWYEHEYNTRLIHRNLAFPLLKALKQAGDPLANRVFKEEIAKRLESGYPSVVAYLINQDYLRFLKSHELEAILESPTFKANLVKNIHNYNFRHFPKRFYKKIKHLIPKKIRKTLVKPSYVWGYDATYKVVILGDSESRKKELTQRFLTNLFRSDTKMTIGVDFEVKSLMINEKKVKLQIWDFEGEERFRFLLPTYVRGANGALFIYNAANYNSLAHIDDWLLVVRKEIKSDQDTFPIVVVGIVPEFEEERQVSAEQGIRIAKSRGVNGFIECSPKTGENVEETFDALTRLMLVKSKILI